MIGHDLFKEELENFGLKVSTYSEEDDKMTD